MIVPKATEACHLFLKRLLKNGDCVIDATCGNGYDTLFLARQVSPKGKVYALDIQDQALENTKELLQQNQLLEFCQIIKLNHALIGEYFTESIQAITFNLGFLPRSDHRIITTPPTTIAAIKGGLNLLTKGGLISVVAYSAHLGGTQERNSIFDFLTSIDQKICHVLHYKFINQINHPPELFMIEKRVDDHYLDL